MVRLKQLSLTTGKVRHLHTDLIVQRLLESPETALQSLQDSGAWKDDYFHKSNFAQISGLSHLAVATQHDQGETLESQKAFTWGLNKMSM